MAHAALHAIAFALDDAKQPRIEGLDSAQAGDVVRRREQRFLHRIFDIIDDAVMFGIAAQVAPGAGEYALERFAIAVACRKQIGID